MGKWPQQGVFAERVKEFCRQNGMLTARGAVMMDVVSDLFNLHEETLRQFLQNKGRSRPHIDTLTRMAGVMGCRVTDFLDAPSEPVLGVGREGWEKLSEQDRVYATALFGDLAESDLTPPEKDLLFGAYQDLKARLLKLRGQG
jgi:transcriptional regulator with XRE-family HTH domain